MIPRIATLILVLLVSGHGLLLLASDPRTAVEENQVQVNRWKDKGFTVVRSQDKGYFSDGNKAFFSSLIAGEKYVAVATVDSGISVDGIYVFTPKDKVLRGKGKTFGARGTLEFSPDRSGSYVFLIKAGGSRVNYVFTLLTKP